jgi:hypothetical protein
MRHMRSDLLLIPPPNTSPNTTIAPSHPATRHTGTLCCSQFGGMYMLSLSSLALSPAYAPLERLFEHAQLVAPASACPSLRIISNTHRRHRAYVSSQR